MKIDVQIDGCDERDFRRSIEEMLRNGDADAAAARLKALLPACCGEGKVLPARFLSASAADIEVTGWDRLPARLAELDRPDHPITALDISISNPCHNGGLPDPDGRLEPYIETSFFSDDAWPFSLCDRSALLDGYTSYGSEWRGSFDDIDGTIALIGIGDLYGAIEMIEAESYSELPPTPDEQLAYVLGFCYIAVLVHIAVRDKIASHGLSRPLAVMVASNESYPFFDAPVAAFLADGEEAPQPVAPRPVEAEQDDEDGEHDPEAADDGAQTASLLMIRKPAAPVADLPEGSPPRAEATIMPLSGSQLRRNLVANAVDQERTQGGLRGFVGRLLRRA